MEATGQSCEDGGARARLSPLSVLALLALGATICLAYSSWGRPLWIDEFVHFALAGMPPEEALPILYRSLGPNLSHGQTGAYLLWDYFSLRTFGTDLALFRLPSLISMAVLLTAAAFFLRQKGLGAAWLGLAIIALGAQSSLLWHGGSARPYMPLAATVVASLAYFDSSRQQRSRPLALFLGLFGVLVGSISHPYFLPFLVLIIGYAAWHQMFVGALKFNWADMARFLNIPLLTAATGLYVLIGAVSWLRGIPQYTEGEWDDPTPLGFAREFLGTHFEFFARGAAEYPPRILLGSAILILGVGVTLAWGVRSRSLVPPTALLALALGTSGLVIAASLRSNYELFSRQWVTGMALAAIAAVWFLAESWRSRRHTWVRLLTAVAALVICLNAAISVVGEMGQIPGWLAEDPTPPTYGKESSSSAMKSIDDWVQAGNDNVNQGGEVWPWLGDFYAAYR